MTNTSVLPKRHFKFLTGLALVVAGGYLNVAGIFGWEVTAPAIVIGFLLLRHELIWHWAYSLSAVVGLSLLVLHWWPLLMFFAAFPKTKHVRVIEEEGSDMNTSKTNYWLMALYLLPLVFTIGLLTMGYLSSADKISIDEISIDDVYRKLLVIVPALILFSLFAWVSLKGAVSVVGIILLFVVFGFTWLSVPLAIGILISLRKLNDAGFFKYSHDSDYDHRERYRELFRLNINGSDPGASGQIDNNTNTNTNPWIF